jgi:WD40 repeat protein
MRNDIMKILETIELQNKIKHLKYIGNSLIFFSDEESIFYIADLKDGYKLKRQNRIGTLSENEKKLNMHQFSKDGKFLAINDRTKKRVNIFDFEDRKSLFSVDWHTGEVETVVFDSNNNYLATGGQDGKSFLWSLETGKMTFALPPHSDFITTIAFNHTSSWIATGSFDNKIKVTNIYAANKKIELAGAHSGQIKFLSFISDNRLVSVDQHGCVVVWDYVNSKIIKSFKAVDEPLSITFIFNDKFMLLSTKIKTVALYDLVNYEFLSRTFIKVDDVSIDMDYVKDLEILSIATASSNLITVDLKSDENILKELINEKKYVDAYALVNQNPTLLICDLYKTLENMWERTCSAAYRQLETFNLKNAKALFSPFMGIPSKSNYIQTILSDFAEFEKFAKFAENKKYQLAYQLAFKYPTYKESKYYKIMESDWNKMLESIKLLITNGGDDVILDSKIDQLTSAFKGISSKVKFISEIKQQKNVLKLFRTKMKNEDYKIIFKLLVQYPFLKELDDYEKLLKLENTLHVELKNSEKTDNHHQTKKLAQELMEFPNFKEESTNIYEKISKKILFLDYYATQNYNKMLEVVESAPFLEDTKEFKEFDKSWLVALKKAEIYAAKGDINGILSSFADFMDITQRVSKIGSTLSMVYILQIQLLSKKFPDKIETILKSIKKYIYIFGKDDSIEALIKYNETTYAIKFSETQIISVAPNLKKWRDIQLPEKIYS